MVGTPLIRRWFNRGFETERSDVESLLLNEAVLRNSEAESSCGDISALRSAAGRGKRAWLFFDSVGRSALHDVCAHPSCCLSSVDGFSVIVANDMSLCSG
jgi:hypothetical protein